MQPAQPNSNQSPRQLSTSLYQPLFPITEPPASESCDPTAAGDSPGSGPCANKRLSSSEVSENSLEPKVTSEISAPKKGYRDTLIDEFPAEMSAAEEMYRWVSDTDKKNYISQILECRTNPIFKRNSETGLVKVLSDRCGLRWCPLCAKSRQAVITIEAEKWFKKVSKPVLITLTLKHSKNSLKNQINILYKSFNKLRNRQFFKKRSRGGIWFFHIKRSKTDGLWHPHLHCLMDSDFMDKKALSDLWCKITKGSFIVHIKGITNPANSVSHAARYSAKPANLKDHDFADTLELFYALKGKRICGTWGTGRTMDLRKKRVDEKGTWKSLGDWSTIVNLLGVDDRADAIYKAYIFSTPLPDDIDLNPLELEMEGVGPRPPPKLSWQSMFKFAS